MTRGFHSRPRPKLETTDDIIADTPEKQACVSPARRGLSALLDQAQQSDAYLPELARHFALQGRSASRISRLLRPSCASQRGDCPVLCCLRCARISLADLVS